jgi:hypothetical protein
VPGGLHHACTPRLQLESPLARVGRRALSRTNQGKVLEGSRPLSCLVVVSRPALSYNGPASHRVGRAGLILPGVALAPFATLVTLQAALWSRTRGEVRVPRNTVGQFIAVLGIILLILLILQFV